ncbi:MFS transporter/fungal specific transcription factor domain-containing protein [Aspergillus alliaceus]|uniref:MFS transporter/fungal specific transcription factor domain-containing protein n=1 Tax=Petromyces alliaceus TaxID=209559 RepID=UPI0012A7641C|nr:bicyclomycin resistance protein [Aspergillus alliaceus]KAB8237942.1 bicyclomycin resistance protein [Aspergillus alliaceus]
MSLPLWGQSEDQRSESGNTTDNDNLEAQIEKCPETTLSMGEGKAFPPLLPDLEDYVVTFDGPEDPEHPYNWKFSAKLYISVIVCFGTFVASFASAIFAPGTGGVATAFGVSSEVGILGTTLFVLGFASGPMIWAPSSELIGRRWPLTVGMFGVAVFSIASAVAKDIQTVIICRFFAGLFGASQLSVVPAVLSDLFNNTHRGPAITVYSLAVFVGPFIGPFVGGFISSSYLGWRWTLYIPAIMGFAMTALNILFVKETYAPILLISKAEAIRHQTSNWGIHAKQEKVKVDFQELLEKYFTRPLRMLITEPIILVISLYMSFIYGLVYALLVAYPYVFESVYGMNPGEAGLTFFGLIIGLVCACGFVLSQQSVYVQKLVANKNVPVPEWRLPPAIIGAPIFTVGVFWFSWTAFTPNIHWMVPTASGVLIGFGILCIFLPCFNYLVDSFLPLAASTVAANIILRSSVAAGFPLFAKQMFKNLGVQWAGTLIGCLAAIMIPIPLLFKKYGPQLRGNWGYQCHYHSERRVRQQKPSDPPLMHETKPSPGHASSYTESLEANSGAAFVRKIGLKMDPANAPKLNLFGWNVGRRKPPPGLTTVLPMPIIDILSLTHMKALANIYFAKVDPCYGFIDSSVFFRRLEARWRVSAEDNTYDGVLAGVAALGLLFSEVTINVTEAHLVELARSIADTHIGSAAPSVDVVTTWVLRVIYMRMTAPPYPTWIASSTLMHLIEASKLHQDALYESCDPDTRRRLIGVAQHQNLWISYDLGLSRVSFPHDTVTLPAPSSGDFTVELLGLLPLSTSLGPENLRQDQEIEELLLQTLSRSHTQPPSVLAQCNLVLCLLRRLHMRNLVTSPATMERVMEQLKRSLGAARRMLSDCCPWQHVANVPFQMISILLEMDTSASLELLPDAMQTLRLVAVTYDTETMREAYGTACLLILLYQRRRHADTKLLSGLLEDHHQPSGADSPIRATIPSSDEVSWLEGLVAEVPTLQGLDFGQFWQPDMVPLPLDASGVWARPA